MKCPYTGEDLHDAGDGIVMCDSCQCWGFSKTEAGPYCNWCGIPHTSECLRK